MAKVCIDPVCKCDVGEKSEYTSEFEGQEVSFCSIECKEKFDIDPRNYMAKILGERGQI